MLFLRYDHVRQHALRLYTWLLNKDFKKVDDCSNFGSEFCLKAHWHTILSVRGTGQCVRDLSFAYKMFSISKSILDVVDFDVLNQ